MKAFPRRGIHASCGELALRTRCDRLSAFAFACVLASCGHPAPAPIHAPPPPPAPDAPAPDSAGQRAGLSLTITPPDAEVLIDGVSYGTAEKLAPVVELKPGLYTLMVSHAGYAPYRVEFSVADKIESFVVHLEPVKK
jgi:hypothetical protein